MNIRKTLTKFSSLNNKKVFIIGGSGLIGTPTVDLFLAQGCRVFILDILNPKKNYKSKKIKYSYFDCSNSSNLAEKYSQVLKKFGCPDIYINCSYPTTKDWHLCNFDQIKTKYLQENLDIHLVSYSILSQLTAEKMKRDKIKGSIINLGSIYGIVGQDIKIYKGSKNLRENMAYAIIKSGIIGLTKQMASHYGKYKIRVNAVSPGGIYGHNKNDGKKQDKYFLKNYEERVPLKRLCYPEEVASSILFLSSSSANYITGTNLTVDGGWTSI